MRGGGARPGAGRELGAEKQGGSGVSTLPAQRTGSGSTQRKGGQDAQATATAARLQGQSS